MIIGIVREAGVIDPLHPPILAQKFGDPSCILHVALDAESDGFNPLEQQKRTQRRQDGTHRPLINASTTSDIGSPIEMRCIHETVIRRVGLAEHRKLTRVLFPRKVAAVYNDAAE